jgi:D-inositol-3-phosphate glycosyltransferase
VVRKVFPYRVRQALFSAKRRLGSLKRPVAPPRDRAVWIDQPVSGATVRGSVLLVRGWALFESGMPSRVEVRLDGKLLGLARLAISRPDVGATYRSPDAEFSGFELDAFVGNLGRGSERPWLTVVCHGVGGELAEAAPLLLRLGAPPPPSLQPTNKQRLLAVTHQLDLGGGQLYFHDLLSGLVAQYGFEITLVSLGDGVLRQRAEELGMTVKLIAPWGQRSVHDYEARQAELVEWAREEAFDAVLVNTLTAFGGADLAGRLSLPCLWAIHESFPLELFWWAAYGRGGVAPAVKACAERALRHSTALIFEAQATRALFEPYADSDRRLHIPYGVDIDGIDSFRDGNERERTRSRLGIAPSEFLILCVGTVQPRKGQNFLLRAFEDVASRYRETRLVFVGDLGDGHGHSLRERASRSIVATRVQVLPVVENVYEWYRAGDLLVCASDVESMPRTVLEAMAFELPVLGTDVFGLPELIQDGVTGYLCQPNDRLSLGSALSRSLDDPPQRRREIASAARSMVCQRHDVSGFVTAYAALLDGLFADRPARRPGSLAPQDPDLLTVNQRKRLRTPRKKDEELVAKDR